MIRHLTPADWRMMPWANGQGSTTELIRVDRDGALLWRLSIAQVVSDGPFSQLPGVRRNLTVLTGPGFRLTGPGIDLWAAPLVPVTFDGGLPVAASSVTGPSEDFNVMTDRRLPLPWVNLINSGMVSPPPGGLLAVLTLSPRHLMLTDEPLTVTIPALAVILPGTGPLQPL
jgi:uncharacterized protein